MNFEKYSFKDVVLAWSRFLKNSHQEPLWLLFTHNCSIAGPIEENIINLRATIKVGQIFVIDLSHLILEL